MAEPGRSSIGLAYGMLECVGGIMHFCKYSAHIFMYAIVGDLILISLFFYLGTSLYVSMASSPSRTGRYCR